MFGLVFSFCFCFFFFPPSISACRWPWVLHFASHFCTYLILFPSHEHHNDTFLLLLLIRFFALGDCFGVCPLPCRNPSKLIVQLISHFPSVPRSSQEDAKTKGISSPTLATPVFLSSHLILHSRPFLLTCVCVCPLFGFSRLLSDCSDSWSWSYTSSHAFILRVELKTGSDTKRWLSF